MRQTVTISLDADVVAAAQKRAAEEHRSLTDYVETLMLRDLGQEGEITVIAPEGAEKFEPIPAPGESAEDLERRRQLAETLLKLANR
jgi:hypothetical protein